MNTSRVTLDSPLSKNSGNILSWLEQPVYKTNGGLDWDKTDWTNTITYRQMAEWVANDPDSRMVTIEKCIDPNRPLAGMKVAYYAVQYAGHGWHTLRHVTKEAYDYYKTLTEKVTA